MAAVLTEARRRFHQDLVEKHTLALSPDHVASNADRCNKTSAAIALEIAKDLAASTIPKKLAGQRAGRQFEQAVARFLEQTFPSFRSLRPGNWTVSNVGGSRSGYHIAKYEPYTHLAARARLVKEDRALAAALGNSYQISPDIVVVRSPEPDEAINCEAELVDADYGRHAVIRRANQDRPIVHAIVSCKWTLRSDRAQSARTEALNLIRDRKGRTPHTVVVTGDPAPSRLASLALGTGDIDTVYHFALTELIKAVDKTENDEAISMLDSLVQGKRLRDIADLPLDLAV
ncbi:NgoMIV family type II restriction endonuclease [Actinomadura litoris]|uniref:NgoMIV family type II restriction endonuclease n=1 Tax=Actinomadura litoris TaxID=2678616 RepID=UPI001FA7B589|nr:NgoMIV family type II restriction endonuclease [Actinomadura litoris]